MAFTAFISSTYQDLVEYRSAVVQALRNAGFHPIDMIHFMARPEGASSACLSEVAEADLFIGIYAYRYGYVPGDSTVSITEQEFNEARRLNKPCFCFMVDENQPWPLEEQDTGENARKLKRFKSHIDKTLVRSTFTTPGDLAIKVLSSLKRWELKPGTGDSFSGKNKTRPQNELILLERVEEAWIEGVLKHSLHQEVMISLEKESRPDAVQAIRDLFSFTILSSEKTASITSLNVSEIFDASGQALLILGEPGAGKTITLLELTRDLIKISRINPVISIPVVLNLSSWSANYPDLDQWIIEELYRNYRIPRSIAKSWVEDVENHPLVFLLDGLDEVKPELQSQCVTAVNRFRDSHGFSGIVVACREAEYEEIAENLHLEMAIRIHTLTDDQIQDYLKAVGGSQFISLQKAIDTDPVLKELARSPLMLNIMTMVYSDSTADQLDSDDIHDKEGQRRRIFDVFTAQMLRRRKSSRNYSDTQSLRWLIWLAKQMKSKGFSVFHIENLQPFCFQKASELIGYLLLSRTIISIAIIALCLSFAIWLQSLKESISLKSLIVFSFNAFFYLYLIFLSSLCLLDFIRIRFVKLNEYATKPIPAFFFLQIYSISLLVSVGALGRYFWPTEIENMPRPFISTDGGWILFLLQIALFFGLRRGSQPLHHDIQTVEGIRWLMKDFFTFFIITIIIEFLLMIGFAPSIFEIIVQGEAKNMILLSWIVAAIIVALFASLRFDGIEKEKTLPNQGIRMSVQNSLIIGPSIGLLFFTVFIITGATTRMFDDYMTKGLFFGLIMAGYASLWYGGIDVIQHYSLRLLLYFTGKAPLHYARFLDDVTQRLFLRKVGGGYIFLHRLLLEHFTTKAEP